MPAKKKATTKQPQLPVPKHIQDLFEAATVAGNMSENYAKVSVHYLAEAWGKWTQIHPRIEGYYYEFLHVPGVMLLKKKEEQNPAGNPTKD